MYLHSNKIISLIITVKNQYILSLIVYFLDIGLLLHKYFYFFAPNTHCALVVAVSEKKKVPFSMAVENVELIHECFPKHS